MNSDTGRTEEKDNGVCCVVQGDQALDWESGDLDPIAGSELLCDIGPVTSPLFPSRVTIDGL